MTEHVVSLDEVYGSFREEVASSFRSLVDEYGCRIETLEEGRDSIFTRFSNRTTAVEVSYESNRRRDGSLHRQAFARQD